MNNKPFVVWENGLFRLIYIPDHVDTASPFFVIESSFNDSLNKRCWRKDSTQNESVYVAALTHIGKEYGVIWECDYLYTNRIRIVYSSYPVNHSNIIVESRQYDTLGGESWKILSHKNIRLNVFEHALVHFAKKMQQDTDE